MANECHDRALAAAKKADGSASASGGRGPTSATRKVEAGMLDPDGKKISDVQATVANGRADAIKKATGRDLTPEQATALLNDANAKALLGDDFKYYLAEKVRPGGAAMLKAEEAAKTAAEAEAARKKIEEEIRAKAEADRKRAEAQARLKEQERLDAEDRARETAALDRRQAASQNPYGDPNVVAYKSTFNTSPSNMTATAARQNLEGYADAGLPQVAQAASGLKNAMQVIENKIANLLSALEKSEREDVAKNIAKGEGVRSKQLKRMLDDAKRECYGLSSVALKAGLNGPTARDSINDFTSRLCP